MFSIHYSINSTLLLDLDESQHKLNYCHKLATRTNEVTRTNVNVTPDTLEMDLIVVTATQVRCSETKT